jgi:hypothetical protein
MGHYSKFVLAAMMVFLLAQSAEAAKPISYRLSPRGESPERNNYLSARYDYLLQTNPRYRAYRMWKECRTINFSAELHASCLASFDQYTPVIRR